jgi:putative DNA methylase
LREKQALSSSEKVNARGQLTEQVKIRKKLIEVALPLEAINAASAREKSIRHGHPSTLHLWWARRPLAAARAVIFSQMVDDPSEYVDELLAVAENHRRAEEELERRRAEFEKLKALQEESLGVGNPSTEAPAGTEPTLRRCAADLERERLFDIIKQLVLWQNTTNSRVLSSAREEIWKSWRRTCGDNKNSPLKKYLFNPNKLPALHDPFAGGGTIPLEAQRLGLEAYASDLNPVAVLINKALIEIPPKFIGNAPTNPESRKQKEMAHKRWPGVEGLAEDVRYYGGWMHDEAAKRIGHLYPKIEITPEVAKDRPELKTLLGRKLTVIAWIWARTVKSPNPAFAHIDVPLASNFMLSTRPGQEAYIEPIIESDHYRFRIRAVSPRQGESPSNGTKLARGANFRCLMSGTPITAEYIKAEGKAGRMGTRMMAVVAAGDRTRVYLPPTKEMEELARSAKAEWKPDVPLAPDPRALWTPAYGLTNYGDLFTERQLAVLTVFSDLVEGARALVRNNALSAGMDSDPRSLEAGGVGASAYSDAVALYLTFALDRVVDRHSSIATWDSSPSKLQLRNTFARQGIPMTWDFGEGNPFCESSGTWLPSVEWVAKAITLLPAMPPGYALQLSASLQDLSSNRIVSTDPPYYDNIGYADLSDFFYVWLRRALKLLFPDLLSTLVVPRSDELIASPYRHGSKEKAEAFFLSGMTQAMHRLSEHVHPAFPVTIYYAFKQSEHESESGTSSTGWETFLDAVIRAGFAISGTWPVRTELGNRPISMGGNALASSIVLVCRPSATTTAIATRREFIGALKVELPPALAHLQRGNVAPVDLAQAAIGPGMAVYTRYTKVVDAEGRTLPVREALALINQTLDEVLAEQEGDFDADTRWALAWFEQCGFDVGEYGVAETLSKAKNTSVQGMKDAGILDKKSPSGKVRLLRPSELPSEWDPVRDPRLTVWESVHHLVRRLESGGEGGAAELVSILGGVAEVARELAYRLYTICERKKRAEEALSYNALVQSWPEISRLARETRAPQPAQTQMFQQV